ncbi:MAG: YceI family protein [Elioraea sp.]|nr:YceI family protein [Elioraea sp.]MDW8445060.1 YceI family protein [Acetobacteraceae bacterium]
MLTAPRVVGRRGLICALGLAFVPSPRAAASSYRIDERFGSIAFAVSVLGLFSVSGRFLRFSGDLRLDPRRPEATAIDVVVPTAEVDLPLAEQRELIRSPAYFDSAAHPTARFVSQAVSVAAPDRFLIDGLLTLRGVTNPVRLEARLTERRRDPERGIDTADVVAWATVSRSAFGMVADRLLLSDRVRLDIRLRLEVPDGG